MLFLILLRHSILIFVLRIELCQDLGVESYPSLYFIGYGNFYQSGSYKSNVVKYNADIYPDAILVWLRMLNTISSYQQKWDTFRSLLPFSSHKTRLHQQHAALVGEVDELQRHLKKFTQAEERERSRLLFDEGVDRGDVFPLLSTLDPDDEVRYTGVPLCRHRPWHEFNLLVSCRCVVMCLLQCCRRNCACRRMLRCGCASRITP